MESCETCQVVSLAVFPKSSQLLNYRDLEQAGLQCDVADSGHYESNSRAHIPCAATS
jgi:hypothetical protein